MARGSIGQDAAWFTQTLVSTGMSQAVSALSGPTTRAMEMLGNWTFPNALPSTDELHNAWVYGHITDRDYAQGLRYHGLAMAGAAVDQKWNSQAKLNQLVIDGRLAKPEPLAIFSALLHNRIDEGSRQWIEEHYKADRNFMHHAKDMFRGYWGTIDVMVLGNRQYLNKAQQYYAFKQAGAFKEEQINGFRELQRVIPPPSDLIRMTVKEAFNDEMIDKLHLMDEIGEARDAREWCERQGIGQCTLWVQGTPQGTVNWFDKYWAMHWNHMAPGQIGEAWRRFRPHRMFRYNQQVKGIVPFTDEMYNTLMKANDYPPPERLWLQGLQLTLPRLIDMRNEFFEGIIDEKELFEQQLDRGYTIPDAQDFVKLAKKQKERWQRTHRTPPMDKYATELINQRIDQFRAGIISNAELLQALRTMLVDANAAQEKAEAEQIRRDNAFIRNVVTTIRQAFFTGEMQANTARQMLMSAGLEGRFIDETMQLWTLKMTLPRRVATLRKLQQWARMGLISLPELETRMINLGYAKSSISLAATEVEVLRMQDQLKLQEAERKRIKAELREQKAAARQAAADARTARNERNRFRTAKQVVAWLGKSIISEGQAIDIMREMDVPDADIPRYLQEA